MKRSVRLSPMLLVVVLSPALLQMDDCEQGNTNLAVLEFKVDGVDQVQGFSPSLFAYPVTTFGNSTAVLRAETEDPLASVGYQWWDVLGQNFIDGAPIGVGGGEVTVDVPLGTNRLRVNVSPTQGALKFYTVVVTRGVTATIPMACAGNVFSTYRPADFELTADPLGPVIAGGSFDIEVTGAVDFESYVDSIGALAGALFTRAAIFDAAIPVGVRSGATGSDVVLGPSGPYTCTLDVNGSFGVGAGPYLACDAANNTGPPTAAGLFANTDCVPTVDSNPCLQFVDFTLIDSTADACATCAALDLPGQISKQFLCQGSGAGFCVQAEPFPLTTEVGPFVAGVATEALFGFEDESFPPPIEPPAAALGDGLDIFLGGLFLANKCYMGVPDPATGSFFTLLPDSALMSIPVSTNWCTTTPIDCSGTAECLTDGVCDPGCEPGTGCDRCPGQDQVATDGASCAGGNGTCQSGVCQIASWGVPVLLETDNTGNGFNPQVAVDPNGDAVAVWGQDDGTVSNIYANRLTSGVWSGPELLPLGGSIATGPAQVAVDPNGDAVVVSQQFDGSGLNIYANRLTSGVWGTAVLLETDNTENAFNPQVAVDPNGDAVAVWQQFDGSVHNIHANRLTSGVWGTAVLLETGTGDATLPQVAVDPNGDAVAVWRQSGSIYANRLTSGVWGGPVLVETNVQATTLPQVAVDSNGDAVVVWRTNSGGFDIYANRLTSGVWGVPVLLETNGGNAVNPQVAVDPNGDAVVVWAQSDGTEFSIWSNRLTSGVWGGPMLLETDGGDARVPQVAVDPNGDAVAVWRQSGSIYASHLTSGVWGGPVLLETDTGGASDPQVAVDPNGDAVAVWQQSDGTQLSIYANRFQ